MSKLQRTLYGIGVGPGDPELLTLKGARILQQVPVIFCPEARSDSGSHAFEVVKKILNPAWQKVEFLSFPMKREPEVLEKVWMDAVEKIYHVLSKGSDAAFLTLGDPLLYSTFGYVLGRMQKQHPDVICMIIPGVSSITASAAAAQVPLARTGGRVLILPATYRMDEIREALEKYETVVLIKVYRVLGEVIKLLREMRMMDRAVLVSRCGTPEEKIYRDLSAVNPDQVDYLSTLIVTSQHE